MSDANFHRYLGKLLCTSTTERVVTELRNRKRAVWAAVVKHTTILLDHNVSLQLRLKYFNIGIAPAMLFAIIISSMIKTRLQELNRLLRKMLTRIIGKRRIDNED